MARNKTVGVGTVIPVDVTQEWIDESIPCDKGSCMLTLAAIATLDEKLGKAVSNVKSTNHGITFDLNGYRILCVFNHDTGHYIYKYDETFKRTNSVAKARASVKPFKARLMVESCQKVPVYPPMSEKTKKTFAARKRATDARDHRKSVGIKTGINTSNRRQLSE